MKCQECGSAITPKSYRFTKSLTKSGNSLVITITDEIRTALELEHGNILDVKITKQ